MDRTDWKHAQMSEILGIPHLDARYLPPHMLIALKNRISALHEVGALILYGSCVRGEVSPKSDIDVMIVPLKKKRLAALRKKVMKILTDLENEFNPQLSFSLTIHDGKEDSYFLWELIKDGVVLYCKPEMSITTFENTKPYALISYSYNGLSENDKKNVQRFLFESKEGASIDRANKMEYIAPGVILLPIERSKKVTGYFDAKHVSYGLIKVWR